MNLCLEVLFQDEFMSGSPVERTTNLLTGFKIAYF